MSNGPLTARIAIFAMLSLQRFLAAVASLSAIVAGATCEAGDRAGEFDFYLLALSWSPNWCADAGPRANPLQCRRDPPFGFIVHGLWPQFEHGYPENCPTEYPLRLPRALIDTILDIQPSPGLVGRQWRKHGTCTGLAPADYLALTRTAFRKISIPDGFASTIRDRRIAAHAIERAFIDANPGLTAAGITVTCDGGDLAEVRICLTRDLQFRACPAVDRTGCRAEALTVQAAE